MIEIKGYKTTERYSWERIERIARYRGVKRSKIIVYLSPSLLDPIIDMAETTTVYEKGGFLCGSYQEKRMKGIWRKFIQLYDLIICRNVASNPKKEYNPYEGCAREAREGHNQVNTIHSHGCPEPPSPADYAYVGKSLGFVVTGEAPESKLPFELTFFAYSAQIEDFMVIFDEGPTIYSEPVPALEDIVAPLYVSPKIASLPLSKIM